MPHVSIEFSPNIDNWANPVAIARAVHDVLCASPHLPADAVKTRVFHHDQVLIGNDADRGKGFIAVSIRTRPGREDQVLAAISASVRDEIVASVIPIPGRPLTISVDIQIMNPVTVAHAKL
ncbi:hypothetical protein QCN27_14125 [Cereibacter sp. SYSU M97828]|nr:hypothetical protein [Cereibacter flavus]